MNGSNRKRHRPEEVVAKRPPSRAECQPCARYGVSPIRRDVRCSITPPSPSDPPRCDRPSRQISDFSPNYPDHALRFTAIRASERFRGRVALSALSGPLPRSAITNASARNARHDAPRGPIRPCRQSTKRPTSFPRRALNSPNWTRTSDMRVNSSPLYQLSYRGIGCGTGRIPSAARSSRRGEHFNLERRKVVETLPK